MFEFRNVVMTTVIDNPAHPVDVVVDELVCISGPGLQVLHHVPVVRAGVLVPVVAGPAVGRDAVHPEGVAHPRVAGPPLAIALLLVLVQALQKKELCIVFIT